MEPPLGPDGTDGPSEDVARGTSGGPITTAPPLPSGLVTFVLTDIEGSTKLFRRLGDGYPAILDAHNALLREQWIAHGGAEVKTVGDAFIVAFASASDAMSASVAAQRAIEGHCWPSGG